MLCIKKCALKLVEILFLRNLLVVKILFEFFILDSKPFYIVFDCVCIVDFFFQIMEKYSAQK